MGHSDADVLLHAVMDALLGAANLGDIGTHFPSKDPQYKNISSLDLLRRVGALLLDRGWEIVNVDSSVVAERPRISPYIPQMNYHVIKALGINDDQVGIKATTTEGLGFAGRGEGIAAYAVALVTKAHTNE